MSGSFGIPPGTQWVQSNTSDAQRKGNKGRFRDLSSSERSNIQDVGDNTPTKGSWQYSMMPKGQQYAILGSSPESDEWEGVTAPMEFMQAYDLMQQLRQTGGWGY